MPYHPKSYLVFPALDTEGQPLLLAVRAPQPDYMIEILSFLEKYGIQDFYQTESHRTPVKAIDEAVQHGFDDERLKSTFKKTDFLQGEIKYGPFNKNLNTTIKRIDDEYKFDQAQSQAVAINIRDVTQQIYPLRSGRIARNHMGQRIGKVFKLDYPVDPLSPEDKNHIDARRYAGVASEKINFQAQTETAVTKALLLDHNVKIQTVVGEYILQAGSIIVAADYRVTGHNGIETRFINKAKTDPGHTENNVDITNGFIVKRKETMNTDIQPN